MRHQHRTNSQLNQPGYWPGHPCRFTTRVSGRDDRHRCKEKDESGGRAPGQLGPVEPRRRTGYAQAGRRRGRDANRARGAARRSVSFALPLQSAPLMSGPFARDMAEESPVQLIMACTPSPVHAMADMGLVTNYHPRSPHLDKPGHIVGDGQAYPGGLSGAERDPGRLRETRRPRRRLRSPLPLQFPAHRATVHPRHDRGAGPPRATF